MGRGLASRKGRGPWGQVSGRWRVGTVIAGTWAFAVAGAAAAGALTWGFAVVGAAATGALTGFLVRDISREGG